MVVCAGPTRALVALLLGGCHLITPFDRAVEVPDGSSSLPEVCDNGEDDDGDRLSDCDDPDCQADYECVDPGPSGFTLNLVSGVAETACPGGGAPIAVYDPGTPTCDLAGCSCGTPGGSCTIEARLLSSKCQGGQPTRVTVLPNSCYSTFGADQGGSFTANGGSVTCTPSGTATTTGPAVPIQLALCALTRSGAGCANGQRCVPRRNASFTDRCALASGQQTCPAELPNRRIIGTAFNDQRSCACDCSGTASCGSFQVQLFSEASCGGAVQTVAADGLCKVFNPAAVSMRMTGPASPLACTPTATVTGMLIPVNEQTLCCP
jgi:hypothetical protein